MSAEKTIVLITGANRGLGFETCKNLLSSSNSYHILLGSRDLSQGTTAVDALYALNIKGTAEAIQIDVADDASVDAAAKHVKETHGRIDILVNNAALLDLQNKNRRENFRSTLAVNLVGAVSTTEAFLPLLRKSSIPRLVFVGSSTGSMTLTSKVEGTHAVSGAMEYRASKAALHLSMVLYNIQLRNEGIKVSVADPGLNATGLGGNPEALVARGAPDSSIGGERIAMVIRGDRDADLGKICGHYEDGSTVCPW